MKQNISDLLYSLIMACPEDKKLVLLGVAQGILISSSVPPTNKAS